MYSHFLNVRVSCLDLMLGIRFRLVSRFFWLQINSIFLVEVGFFSEHI